MLYALNTEFEVSQSVKVCIGERMTDEVLIPSSTMTFFAIRNGVVFHPQHIETAIESWTDESLCLASPFEQEIAFWSLGDKSAQFAVNGQVIILPAAGTATVCLPRTQGSIPDEFFAENYLEEPDIDVTNCALPY